MSNANRSACYPPIEPYRSGTLQLDDVHSMVWEECGNPNGEPVVFLHGGPGSGCSPWHRQLFDPAHYRIVLFDQRGAGRSTPLGEIRNNTTQLLVADIERLRLLLGISRWLVFGGSWGSTLALAYGQTHPAVCKGFVLRGVFLGSADEITWFLHGMGRFFPQEHDRFASHLPPEEQADILGAYCKRLFGDDLAVGTEAARIWSGFEGSCLHLVPDPQEQQEFESPQKALGVGRLEAHYFRNGCFLQAGQLLRDVDRVRHLPAIIVQGRYDVICPPVNAWRLHRAWPGSRLQMVEDAGHAASEPGIEAALVAATNRFRDHHQFS